MKPWTILLLACVLVAAHAACNYAVGGLLGSVTGDTSSNSTSNFGVAKVTPPAGSGDLPQSSGFTATVEFTEDLLPGTVPSATISFNGVTQDQPSVTIVNGDLCVTIDNTPPLNGLINLNLQGAVEAAASGLTQLDPTSFEFVVREPETSPPETVSDLSSPVSAVALNEGGFLVLMSQYESAQGDDSLTFSFFDEINGWSSEAPVGAFPNDARGNFDLAAKADGGAYLIAQGEALPALQVTIRVREFEASPLPVWLGARDFGVSLPPNTFPLDPAICELDDGTAVAAWIVRDPSESEPDLVQIAVRNTSSQLWSTPETVVHDPTLTSIDVLDMARLNDSEALVVWIQKGPGAGSDLIHATVSSNGVQSTATGLDLFEPLESFESLSLQSIASDEVFATWSHVDSVVGPSIRFAFCVSAFKDGAGDVRWEDGGAYTVPADCNSLSPLGVIGIGTIVASGLGGAYLNVLYDSNFAGFDCAPRLFTKTLNTPGIHEEGFEAIATDPDDWLDSAFVELPTEVTLSSAYGAGGVVAWRTTAGGMCDNRIRYVLVGADGSLNPPPYMTIGGGVGDRVRRLFSATDALGRTVLAYSTFSSDSLCLPVSTCVVRVLR